MCYKLTENPSHALNGKFKRMQKKMKSARVLSPRIYHRLNVLYISCISTPLFISKQDFCRGVFKLTNKLEIPIDFHINPGLSYPAFHTTPAPV